MTDEKISVSKALGWGCQGLHAGPVRSQIPKRKAHEARNPYCIHAHIEGMARIMTDTGGLRRAEHAAAHWSSACEKAVGGVWFATGNLAGKTEGFAQRSAELETTSLNRLPHGGSIPIPRRKLSAPGCSAPRSSPKMTSSYPALLKQIHDPPMVLYVWGALRNSHAIGIVGTRKTIPLRRRVREEARVPACLFGCYHRQRTRKGNRHRGASSRARRKRQDR